MARRSKPDAIRRRAIAHAQSNGSGSGPRSSTGSGSGATHRPRHAVVVVLGDVGRSPRMQYHAVSLARLVPALRVSLVGHTGERCVPDVYELPNLEVRTFAPRMQRLPRKLFALLAPIKVLVQLCQLFWMLLVTVGSIDLVLLQNPPTIPTFVVVWMCCRLKGAKFVIDWHNLGYSILALSLGPTHPLVRVATWVERVFGRKADANFCVTHVMKQWLWDTWKIRATVLHDKPPLFFKPTSVDEQHELFLRIGDQLSHVNEMIPTTERHEFLEQTITTRRLRATKQIVQREDRPAIMISSTSWTADEDFGILLTALTQLNARTAELPVTEFPNLLVIVTGKGPQKEMYLRRIEELAFPRIRIETLWLEAADYPRMLGTADLGVCLHTSSSGLDLPMKVLDMFGCGVPVCAVGFSCLGELVQHGRNGLVFDNSEQLATQLEQLLRGFPTQTTQLDHLRSNLTQVEHWPENWNHRAAPVFRRLLRLPLP